MNLTRPFLLAALGLALSAPAAAQDRTPGYLTVDGLKDELGVTVRWLRTQQDPETGSYGGWKENTWALKTFAASPWRYGYEDGPFVSRAVDLLLALQDSSGLFLEKGAGRSEILFTTTACGEALSFFSDVPKVAEALAKARKVHSWSGQASWEKTFAALTTKELLTMAEDRLRTRGPEGFWDHKFGKIVPTGRHMEFLCGIYEALEAREKALMKPEPTQAKALPAFSAADRGAAEQALARGAGYLVEQAEDGRWGFPGRPDPGITAMVAGALLSAPRGEEVDAAVTKALDWLVSLQREDGSIHAGQYANYVTSAAVMALARAGREEDREAIAKARAFLQRLQADESEGYRPDDRYYGGVGYGGDERPDLSNLQMALDALHAAGVEAGDPTMKKALAFLERCQNRSESNDLVVVKDGVTVQSGDDGGAAYAPGESKAGMMTLADGTQVPRSYGSMTYALLKGYLFAGLPRDDPRVEAAWAWLSRNYTLDVNPGFEASSDPTAAYQGLFYYFHTMARALDLYGAEVVQDAAGVEHAWRGELIGRIASMQRQDGSWVNENAERWYEGNPVLATAYAMMTLEEALPDAPADGGGK